MKFIDWFADGSVYVVDLALACCGVESGAAVLANAPVREEIPDGAPIDSAGVVAGLPDAGVDADHWIPGCPPGPETLTGLLASSREAA